MTDKLYRVVSIIDGFPYGGRYFDGVEIIWFYSERREFPIVDYKKIADENLDDLKSYTDELFSLSEANRVKKYLDKHFKDINTEIIEINLEDTNYKPLKSISVGGGIDFYLLWKEEGYPLSFKVEGLFDIRPPWRKENERRWQIERILVDLDLYELPSLTIASREVYVLDSGKRGGDFLLVSFSSQVDNLIKEKGLIIEEVPCKVYIASFKEKS
ncbi:MAG: hypothetical protein ACP5RW_05995 [bacterium]